jgi:flagellar biosynthetic protein FliR
MLETQSNATDWNQVAPALVLALVRISTMLALAPFFSSKSLPNRTKAIFAFAVCILLVPTVAVAATRTPGIGPIEISFTGLMGEVAIGALYGLTLGLLNEMLLLTGQIVGLQFSFSLVNLLDPASEIQTPLMGDLFQLMGTLVLIAGGFDRVMLASMIRSIRVIPLGTFPLSGISTSAPVLVPLLSGSFFAALELAAPVLAATVLVEIAVALIGKLSPQLPVISLTVPMKTLTGFVLLIGALSLWPRFIEARFSNLLDVAERLISQGVSRGRG